MILVDINLALRVAEKIVDYATLVHNDIPVEERRKFHQRIGYLWDLVWQHAEKANKETTT